MTLPNRTPSTWHLTPDQRLAALGRRLDELRGWRDRHWTNLTDWTFTFPGAAPVPLRLGDPWPQVDPAVAGGPVLFQTSLVMPEGLTAPVLELDVGGEGLVSLSTGLSTGRRAGLNPYHRRFALEAQPGQTVSVTVEAVPKGLFGQPTPEPRLRLARLVQPETAVEELCLDLEVLLEAAAHLRTHPAAPHLLSAAEDALSALRWPSGADAYLGRLDAGVGVDVEGIWNRPAPLNPQPLSDEVLGSVQAVREALSARLDALQSHLPPVGALALSGHAHLDLAWLWPIAETKRKAVRTFETVLRLMDQYPDFTFNQSSAQLYAWIEAEQPELFGRIRARVQEGRWETVGGMWVEPDAMMSGGESLARQLLYGQRYFQSRFGRRSTVAWLPDTFGFSGTLPQLLVGGGLGGFFTTKLTWNETTPFPHDLWLWEGTDGTRVLAHSFKNDVYGVSALGSYNGDLAPEHVGRVRAHDRSAGLAAWRGQAPESLFTFGFGDGAGGPSAEMLRRFERLKAFPGLPRLRHTRIDDFFRALPRQGLPVWVGELYFELHRGTLSSQAAVKRLHRQAEHRLIEADVALALAHWQGQAAHSAPAQPDTVQPDIGEPDTVQADRAQADRAQLEDHWKTLLLHEFHDILPGSSIHEVYAQAIPALEEVVQGATRLRDGHPPSGNAPEAAGTDPRPWNSVAWNPVVWNPSLFARPLRALWPDQAGSPPELPIHLPTQRVQGGTLLIAPDVLVPPLGQVSLHDLAAWPQSAEGPGFQVRVEETGDGHWLIGDRVRVQITPAGHLARLVTASGRDALGAGGHRLVAFGDHPRAWEAWDINADTQDAALGEELPAGTVRVLETGPLRASVQIVQQWRASRIVQTVQVTAGSARVDLHTQIHWQERRTLLKAFVDVHARSDHATFETAFGVTRRPTHRNHPSDAAQFEGSAHRFADLSEPGFGLALLNDGKYGHSAYGSVLSLTLLRGPLWPDPLADLGDHEFTYSLLPHTGDWTAGEVLREALDLNSPLILTHRTGTPRPPVRLSGLPVALGTLKVAEDGPGLILRVYEPYGARGALHLHTDRDTKLQSVNLLEDDLLEEDLDEAIPVVLDGEEQRWTVQVRPFQVLSFRLTRR